MRKEAKKEARTRPPFRFLSHPEFAALSQDERIKYLQQAIEAVKSGIPFENMPTKDKH